MKHDLLFERFLSIDRVTLPVIDIDFDDEGRERVLEWLQQKYGKECCAHVVSFRTFSTDNAFSTVARVNQMHAPEILAINKLLYYWRPSIKDYVKYEPEIRKLFEKSGTLCVMPLLILLY